MNTPKAQRMLLITGLALMASVGAAGPTSIAAQAEGAPPPASIQGASQPPLENTALRAQRDSLYIAVLEKTNQQLSLATNPWSLMVAGLGVLFTIGAIVAAWLLYTQGRDFREQQTKTLKDANEAINKLIADVQARSAAFLAELKAQADLMHADLTKRIDEATSRAEQATGEAKNEVKKNIDSLKSLQASVESQQRALAASDLAGIPSSYAVLSARPAFSMSSVLDRRQKCVQCGKVFKHDLMTSAMISQDVRCPYCGTEQASI